MKRLISLMLAAVILFSVVPVSGYAVSEDSQMQTGEDSLMHTSEECIDMLKEYEGFSEYPYWDYGQYTVGYGTRCPDDMLDYYREHGITEEEAETLLQNFLTEFESDLYVFADKYGITFTQNQFDALILFSYNCGSGWVYTPSSEFHQGVATGASADDMVYRFSLWCSAGGSILNALIRRRLCEANLYNNGVYSTTVPENYCYVIYNANGGSVDSRVQGYNSDSQVAFASTATYEGHTFLGWFTAKTDGTQVTTLDASVNGKTLYAQWEAAEGTKNPDASDTPDTPEEPKDSVTVKVTDSDVNYRKGPGTNYTILGQKQLGDELVITATAEANGYLWGQFADGWIALSFTNYDEVKNGQTEEPDQTETTEPEASEPEQTEPEEPPKKTMGTIQVTDYLNIRENPGTGYAVVGYYYNGDRVEILEQKTVGAIVWGRTDKGWISMDYVVLDEETAEGETPKPDDSQTNTVVTGVVSGSDFLRIRSGPGTSYSVVGYLYTGDRVTITELYHDGSMTWGKIDQGWISMDYVTPDEEPGGSTTPDEDEPSDETIPMHRLYNPNSGEHFYTGSTEEKNNLVTAGWIYEGVAWNAPAGSENPVYRLYNPNSGDHHYTMSVDEVDALLVAGWKYEGIGWNSAPAEGNMPLYRLYNPNADCGSHHYTGSEEERDNLVAAGWIYEGIGWYGTQK